VLAGGAGLVAGGLLAACSGGDNKDTDAGKTPTSGSSGDKSLVALFDTNTTVVAGSEQRMTFGVGDAEGTVLADSPAKLRIEVRDTSGKVVGKTQTVARHNSGLPRGYYPVLFTPPAPGSYEVATELDGRPVTAAFEAITADQMRVPAAGAPMPDLHTPTTADHRGVNPICTRQPACSLHAVDLADARTSGKPIALLIATPAYCQVAICGPVLDVLLDGRKPLGDRLITIHAEVYRSAKQVEDDPSNAPLAPLLDALHLNFEPCLFLIQPDGRIAKRLDTIFDAVELRQELTALVG